MKNWTGRLLRSKAGQEIVHPQADLGLRGGDEVTPNVKKAKSNLGGPPKKGFNFNGTIIPPSREWKRLFDYSPNAYLSQIIFHPDLCGPPAELEGRE